jgi:Tfp pilus assembly protein FimT
MSNRKPERNSSGEDGLTVVESTVVLLVIAIILAFALPAVSTSIKAYNLRSSANHMAERIAAVRALAMAKNENVTFSFNDDTGQYGFDFTGTTGDGVPDTTDPDDPSINYYSETLPSDITAVFPDNNPIKVTFNSRGEMPIGSTERALVIQSSGKSATVRVNLRGKVSVE